MIDIREPRFRWGQRVAAQIDLANDGSYPEQPADALLAPAGSLGEIVQVGHHAEAGVPVYLVEFEGGRVIGCLEEEIAPASPRALPRATAAA
ncbi:nitrogen fixation protein NifZ [Caldimonas tepidiphila]|uniref:nitrogen fixation protein NifZ n=1 Tax=Caldimonas tepidiphila TaxID=2315841 RepID=UPI000E5B14F3|nr:nitrogen fixation protein NifZ [Caldimonas tepidiphila]